MAIVEKLTAIDNAVLGPPNYHQQPQPLTTRRKAVLLFALIGIVAVLVVTAVWDRRQFYFRLGWLAVWTAGYRVIFGRWIFQRRAQLPREVAAPSPSEDEMWEHFKPVDD